MTNPKAKPNHGDNESYLLPENTKVHWKGCQFAVTDYGIERLDGGYEIEADRLAEGDWIEHMHSKDWVNIVDFALAYEQAVCRFYRFAKR